MDLIDRYAELAVRVGVNLQPGQDVLIAALVQHAPLVRSLTEQAYRAGARRVVVRWGDPYVQKAAMQYGPLEALTTSYDWEIAQVAELVERRGALISITGDPDPHLLDGLDPSRVAARSVEIQKAFGSLADRIQWVVIGAPTTGWATEMFGEPDVDRLWQAIAVANRLDTPDPVAAWRDHIANLHARGRALDRLAPEAIRFTGPGTDLTLPMLRGARWLAGTFPMADLPEFIANLPTEEVYGTPHLGRGEGVVRATKPLPMPGGTLVRNLVLRIKAGKVVDAQADTGVELVRRQLEQDEQAAFLGEVSIVDGSSRVFQSGLVFHNTLYDENAGCHIAYGRGYATTVPGAGSMTREEKLAAGLNVSSVHTDVVIGGPEVNVDALDDAGSSTPILRENRWVLPLD